MTNTDDTWTPETLHQMSDTLGQLWPSSDAENRQLLVEGLTLMARRGRILPSLMFHAIVTVAESGRSSLPNVGTIMTHVDARRRHQAVVKRIEPPKVNTGPPWTACLWLAVFVRLGGDERMARLSPSMQERMRPWVALADEFALIPEHNISGTPAYDPTLVRNVNAHAELLWETHGGVGGDLALSIMGARRGGRRRAA